MIEKIGKYRIDGVLGTGAMGVVYKAYDANIARVVALKTVRSELLDGHQEVDMLARFKNEAQASGRLVHPNIVSVYDFGEIDDTTYIAMEFVDGTPLNFFLKPNIPMDLNASMTCMSQLLRALEYAHSRGVVHRDIKPANILITGDAQVKITDFGIAKIESSTLTQVGSVLGTPSYMSPEQFRGESVDGRSDLFAVGIILYQMLTGVRPFTGAASVIMHAIINEMPPKPSERLATLHPAFDAVLARAMAKKAQDRYASAAEFLQALTAAHEAHTGGAPITEEDNERTILTFQKPARMSGLVQGTFAPQSHSGHGSQAVHASHGQSGHGVNTGSMGAPAPWLAEMMPEVQVALSLQIGPMARLLLKNAAAQAADVDDLCDKLMPHITSEQGRTQFANSVRAIKKKLGIATLSTGTRLGTSPSQGGGDASRVTGNTVLQLSPAILEAAEQKLVAYIGPIAKVVVKRAAKNTSNVNDFYRLLADNLGTEQERARFLKEVGAL